MALNGHSAPRERHHLARTVLQIEVQRCLLMPAILHPYLHHSRAEFRTSCTGPLDRPSSTLNLHWEPIIKAPPSPSFYASHELASHELLASIPGRVPAAAAAAWA